MSQTKRMVQNNFSLGELSPRTYGRFDQEWFAAGCRTMQDFIALPQGPAEARPGTIRILKVPDGAKRYRIEYILDINGDKLLLLISEDFIYLYGLEVENGNEYATPVIRVGSVADQVTAPCSYQPEDLYDLQVVNYEGYVYIAHPLYSLVKIGAVKADKTMEIIQFSPVYTEYDNAIKLTYKENDIRTYQGAQYRALTDAPENGPSGDVVYYRNVGGTILFDLQSTDISQYDSIVNYSYGDMCLYNGNMWILGSPVNKKSWHTNGNGVLDGGPWYELIEYAYYPGSIPTVTRSNYSSVSGYNYWTYPIWDDCNAYLTRTVGQRLDGLRPPNEGDNVWLKVTAAPSTATQIKFFYASGGALGQGEHIYYRRYIYEVLIGTSDPPPAPNLNQEASDWEYVCDAPTFNEEGMYPNLIIFHDRRLYVLGTITKPNFIYASQSNAIENFNAGVNDDDSIQIKLQLENNATLSWGNSRKDLVLGGSETEMLISGSDGPITPSNIQAYPQSRAGSMRNGAVEISDATVFFQAGGQRLLRFVYSNDTQSYQTPDMGVLGEHLLSIGVKEFALQTNPDFILWCIMEDGTMLGGTYLPDQQIFGWHKHVTDGEFESVEVTRGETEDIIWLIVRRPIRDTNGNITSYIRQLERFAARRQAHDEKMVYMDDAEILTIVDGKATVSEDKRGQTLTIIQGGAPHQNVTADATTGEITLQYELSDSAFNTCVVGRAYTPKLSPQKIIPGGSMLNLSERISSVSIRFLESLGLYVGIDQSDVDPLPVREGTGSYGEVVEPFTGEEQLEVNDTFDGDGWLLIERKQPFPATILAVAYNLELGVM